MKRSVFAGFGLVVLLLVTASCGSSDSTAPSGSSSRGAGAEGGAPSSSSSEVGGAGASGGQPATSSSSSGTGGSGAAGGTGAAGGSAGGNAGSGGTGGVAGAAGAGGVMACQVDADCADGIGCTADACVANVCVHGLVDALCDDGNFCDGDEVCDPANGDAVTGCAPSSGSPCDDGIACTVDTCDEVNDACTNAPDDAFCGPTTFCGGANFCSVVLGGCSSSAPPSCSDSITCTDDFCDLATDACKHNVNDNKCADAFFCNGAEKCDPPNGNPTTGCKSGTPVNCADGIPCTDDVCDESTDSCDHNPVNAACDDNLFCNGTEFCDATLGCQNGVPVDCDDGLSCTSDSCSNAQAQCLHAPNNAACSNGLDCDGQEICDPMGGAPVTGCKAGAPIPCPPDGFPCTVDACDETTNACAHTPSNGLCPPGQFCVPAAGGCTPSQPCTQNSQCDDGNACNGIETCNVVCQPGTPIDCSDGVACTIDACNPQDGSCSHTVNNAFCNDGLACNGVETCSAAVGCVAGVNVNCDDGVGCTFDQCSEPNGTCDHFPQDYLCDDQQLCNGQETCGANGCQAGAPYVCPPDGIGCTSEFCDPVANNGQGLCKAQPNNALCPCGQTCNPALGGCGNYCNIATCQGKVYDCGDCVDNDADCGIDSGGDTQCLGPCDNTEDGLYGGIPGQANSPCKQDCYFDQDTGAGNDDCYWSHKCDPYEAPPNYPPEDSACAYNPNANIPGTNQSCGQLYLTQSAQCLSYCGPLTPNGCDCFGCCAIEGAPTTVWLGSENPPGTGSCDLAHLTDPTMCKPCTQVVACLNTCDTCEICIGKPTLPPECAEQICPNGVQKCGLPNQPPCPSGYFCNTGCCAQNPG